MRITFRLSKEEQNQLNKIKGKTTSDKIRRAIKLAYIQETTPTPTETKSKS
jgi:hypothetical protein